MSRWTTNLALGTALLVGAAPASTQVSRDSWFPGTSSVTEQEIIPPGYRGAWAPSIEECGDEADIDRIVIYANGIDVGEGGGRLEQITQAGQERSVRLKLAVEGEGRFWSMIWTLTLSSDGQRLTVITQAVEPDEFVRCPPN